jgi:hypothetical protein
VIYLTVTGGYRRKAFGVRFGVMYSIFKRLENGELQHVAFREEMEEAVRLAEKLKSHWPAEYVVKDSEGNHVHPRSRWLM